MPQHRFKRRKLNGEQRIITPIDRSRLQRFWFLFFLEHVRYDTQILTIFFFCSSYFELRGWNVEIRHDL